MATEKIRVGIIGAYAHYGSGGGAHPSARFRNSSSRRFAQAARTLRRDAVYIRRPKGGRFEFNVNASTGATPGETSTALGEDLSANHGPGAYQNPEAWRT